MPVKKGASRRSLGSDLKRVDAHTIEPHEYEDGPELTAEMVGRMVVKKQGRPVSANPRKLLTLRLPADVIRTLEGHWSRMADAYGRTLEQA